MTDARWMARASAWAALASDAKNEVFNITGEPFRWERMWHKQGAGLGMDVAHSRLVSSIHTAALTML
jgi:hypothetical protein